MSLEERTTSSTGGQKGVKLERFDLIPVGPLTELAVHFGRGATKYDIHQWRAGYEWSKSYSSIQRHSNAFWAGQDYDVCENDPGGCQERYPESHPKAGQVAVGRVEHGRTCYNHTGSHHMVAVAWHSFVLLEFKDTHPDHDDRFIIEEREIEGVKEDGADVEVAPDELHQDVVLYGKAWVHYCPERENKEPITVKILPYMRCDLCGTNAPKIEINSTEEG